jgi:PRTRC genetic system protein B
MTLQENKSPAFSWVIPKELGIPADSLRLRLDFFHQSTVLTYFNGDIVTTRQVDAMDVAHALATDLSFGTGLLPDNTLWWQNTRNGPVFALYVAPKVRKLALQDKIDKPPKRFTIPLPGFIFLCQPGQAPWVIACKKRPTKETDMLYHAPLANVFRNGRSCPGSNRYPTRVSDIADNFFVSFFSATADLQGRSKKYPKNVLDLWKSLDGKTKFPYDDLNEFGKVSDLIRISEEGV